MSHIKQIKYLETDSLKFQPYDPCVADKFIEKDPTTVVFHVDDVKASHRDKNKLDNF